MADVCVRCDGKRGIMFSRPGTRETKKEGFMKGVMALMFSQIFIKILGLIYNLYLTNRQGFGDLGNAINGASFQIYALLLAISSIGIPNAISRLVSAKIAVGDNKGAHRIFKVSLLFFGLIGLIGAVLLFAASGVIANNWIQIPEAVQTLRALSPSIFFVAISCVFRGYFNGREKLSVTAKSQGFEQLFKAIGTVVFVELVVMLFGINTVTMAIGANIATTVSTILSLGYLIAYYRKSRQGI